MKAFFFGIILMISFAALAQPAKRTIQSFDLYKLPNVSDPQVSPDGLWVAYTVTTVDSLKDSRSTNIWMVSWDGTTNLQLTHTPESEYSPRWSPDGKYVAFLSSRQEAKSPQIWLMDRRGGEAKMITNYKGGVNAFEWHPSSNKLLLTITDAAPEDTGKIKTTPPMVIDRYQFKQDVEGYRFKKQFTHLYVLDIDTKKTDTLTRGNYDHGSAVWSPDGKRIALVSNRTADPDKNENSDIYVLEAKSGATLKQLTTWTGVDGSPQWSPDGKWIAYTRSTSSEPFIMYDLPILAVVASEGGTPKLLSSNMDRGVYAPRWQFDGNSIVATVMDDRYQFPATFDWVTGSSKRLYDGLKMVQSFHSQAGKWAMLASSPTSPNEIFAYENDTLKRLTKHTDSFLAPLQLAKVKGVSAVAKDGNKVNGVLYWPADASEKKPLPLVVFIHGGPVAQDDYSFNLTSQVLAGAGYAVVNVNYRGSSGRGLAYTQSIYADWGHLEVVDIHAMVDELVKQGLADSTRLGVGGWSYGGILTDYLIATDTRFKAAVSGAGVAFALALYGVDQYILQYDHEIGPPWKNLDKYVKLSYPFLHADRIKTPTLFMVGEKDFNVPAVGSEQMYQALRSLNIPTQYVIYPNQFHGISVPSYQADRLNRYIQWFNKYLKK